MIKRYIFCFLLLIFPYVLIAQNTLPTFSETVERIKKLKVKASALYIAAHPDDENTRLLAYLAQELKVKTGYLSLTRGDGGQNLIGNEQGEHLGLIRTQELLAARKVDGATQYFTRANDFGFSKTADESFKIWGKEQILADVVWVIRNFKPDVIITRFPEDSRAGHGHHAGSAILAREAFSAAADPKRFPEQLKFVGTWQAKRIVWNTFNFGGTNTTGDDQLKIDVGLYNPNLGKSYGEIAAISRTNHKSQGFGSALQRGEAFEYFSHVAGEPAKNSLFDGIPLEWNTNELQNEQLKKWITTEIKLENPSQALQYLFDLKAASKSSQINTYAIDQLILEAAGIMVEATTNESNYAIGDTIPVKVQAIYRNRLAQPSNINLQIENNTAIQLTYNRAITSEYKVATTQKDFSQPFWLLSEHQIGQYNISEQQYVGKAENPNQLTIGVILNLNGQTISLRCPIVFKFTDPIKGEVYQPLAIGPQVTASLAEKAYIFHGNQTKTIAVELKNFGKTSIGNLIATVPKGWKVSPEKVDFSFMRKGEERTVYITISPTEQSTSGSLNLTVSTNGRSSNNGLKTIKYDHIPTITLFPNAVASLQKVDLKIAGKRIAYLDGAGDLVGDALKQVGYEVSHLQASQLLAHENLSTFDAIITGVRFFNVNEDAAAVNKKLMNFAEQGGTVLVQYNVNTNLKSTAIGPYPFKLSNKRVTEEDADVSILLPEHPALNYPNKISKEDFKNWVQERGLYFATEVDSRYAMPISMHDKGEDPQSGSLLIAPFGKGKFVYTSLVFFRELPAGVSGAYRLIANLLASPQR